MSTKESKNLYFLRLIHKAYESDDKLSSFEKAFNEIKSKAADPEYQVAYRNFHRFIETVKSTLTHNTDLMNSIKYSRFEELMIDILSDNFTGSEEEKQEILDYFRKDPEFNRIQKDISETTTASEVLSIEVIKNGRLLGTQPCAADFRPLTISNVTPGEHIVQLSNGRRLWSKKLGEKHVIWKSTFPKKEFPAAAKTEPTKSLTTFSESFLNGELSLDVFPGIESGTIKISQTKLNKK